VPQDYKSSGSGGQKVRSIRLSKKLTQTELANIIGKDHPSINRLEKGKINPSFIFLLEVAEGLEVTISDFFD
jgi:transcriptional regulator with XRE-family HTH domain